MISPVIVHARDKGQEVSTLQCRPQVAIRVGLKGVKVHLQSARKQDGVPHTQNVRVIKEYISILLPARCNGGGVVWVESHTMY